MGKWQLSAKKGRETKRIDFENGYCEYTEETSPCGVVSDDKESKCAAGPTVCNERFELVIDNKEKRCELCEGEDRYWQDGKCNHCDRIENILTKQGGSFECKPKSEMTKITNSMMKKCWRCTAPEYFSNCVKNIGVYRTQCKISD